MLDINCSNTGSPGVLRGMFDVNDKSDGETRELSPTAQATPSPPARACPPSVPTTMCGSGIPAPMAPPFRSTIHRRRAVLSPATVGARRTGPRAVPIPTQASRAITPAAATLCLSMDLSTSSSRRSTCSRTAPSVAATGVKSSVRMVTDRSRLELAFADDVIVDHAAVGPKSPIRSNRRVLKCPETSWSGSPHLCSASSR